MQEKVVKRRSPFDCARDNGIRARVRGEPESACPYKDIRTDGGQVTFSRAYRRAWLKGYRSVQS